MTTLKNKFTVFMVETPSMMKESQEHIDELIAAYLSGNLTPQERETLEAWVGASAENRNYLMRYREIWFSSVQPKESARYDGEKAFAAFQKRIGERKQEKVIRKQPMNWRRYCQYAAAILVLGLVSYFSYVGGETHLKEALAEVRVEAPMGSQTRLHLPDGTSVVLNAGSHITYPQDFGVETRRVKLQGEGYFEVAHNAKMPFSVQSKDLEVRVLGTKFNFRDYPEDEQVSVSLMEGKVSLNNLIQKEAEMILHPNERVVLDKKGGKMVKETIETAADKLWTEGRMLFQELPLSEVATILERNYGVQISFAADSLKDLRFYGDFNSREYSIQDVLKALSTTGRVHYTLNEKQILLY